MDKYKKLIGNSFVFAIGNLGSKLVQFILVPLYSYTLTTKEFGQADLLTQLVFLLTPLVSLELFDGVFRFALDELPENKPQLISSVVGVLSVSSIVCLIIGGVTDTIFSNFEPLLTSGFLVANIWFALISNYARATGYVKVFAIAGILNTLIMGLTSFVLLSVFRQGVQGYLIAFIVGLCGAVVYILAATRMYKQISFKYFNSAKLLELVKYSAPLVPNYFAWWLNSSSDRVFILTMIGSAANGIYAMANKIPNFINLIAQIFSQSWQISVVEEIKNDKSDQFITTVFEVFCGVLFLAGILIVTWIRPLFKLLINHNYFLGWKLTFIMVLAVIYGSVSIILETVYTASKETMIVFKTTLYGAILNVLLTVALIPLVGYYGAAIANTISFAVVVLLRLRGIIKRGLLKVNYRKLATYHVVYFLAAALPFLLKNDVVVIAFGLCICIVIMITDKNMLNISRKLILHKELK
ncbi:lipopolysaccharide biosynthesis protein [Limosilactobacillus ingluviei]|uniref:Membrane protein n=1 Tax=Limosilactobacillus ingluviei DSM 15946 TaxID=1423760 RepID=A0A0R1UH16_9LACO|nr:oligosaccharide flippase family protein [Limosilactobacillus ingluviei]KRL92180.1 membrane protein [Limosilactobacillus ingluviei DSM 15946]